MFNNTGGAITPSLTVRHANGLDIWTSPSTDVSAAALQSCANGAWTVVAWTFTASALASNGLEISFDFGNNFSASTKFVQVSELDIRVTPDVPLGLNNTPPRSELRDINFETLLCQRYLPAFKGLAAAFAVAQALAGTSAAFVLPFITTPRIAPTESLPRRSQISRFSLPQQAWSQALLLC